MPKVVKPHTAIHSSPLGLKDSIMPKKVTEATKSTAKTVEKTLAEPADERAKPAQIASVVKPADPKVQLHSFRVLFQDMPCTDMLLNSHPQL